MRERLGVYLALAIVGAIAGYWLPRPFDVRPLLVDNPAPETLLPIVFSFLRDLIPFIVLSLIARMFIVPSAMRAISPHYRTTPRGLFVSALVLAIIVVFSVLAIYGSALPGGVGVAATLIFAAVSLFAIFLSQTLFIALQARSGESLGRAIRRSYTITKPRFIASLIVTLTGLMFVVVPINIALVPLFLVMLVRDVRWLALGTPLLVLMFVYFECVRFTLVTRWYAQLVPAAVA